MEIEVVGAILQLDEDSAVVIGAVIAALVAVRIHPDGMVDRAVCVELIGHLNTGQIEGPGTRNAKALGIEVIPDVVVLLPPVHDVAGQEVHGLAGLLVLHKAGKLNGLGIDRLAADRAGQQMLLSVVHIAVLLADFLLQGESVIHSGVASLIHIVSHKVQLSGSSVTGDVDGAVVLRGGLDRLTVTVGDGEGEAVVRAGILLLTGRTGNVVGNAIELLSTGVAVVMAGENGIDAGRLSHRGQVLMVVSTVGLLAVGVIDRYVHDQDLPRAIGLRSVLLQPLQRGLHDAGIQRVANHGHIDVADLVGIVAGSRSGGVGIDRAGGNGIAVGTAEGLVVTDDVDHIGLGKHTGGEYAQSQLPLVILIGVVDTIAQLYAEVIGIAVLQQQIRVGSCHSRVLTLHIADDEELGVGIAGSRGKAADLRPGLTVAHLIVIGGGRFQAGSRHTVDIVGNTGHSVTNRLALALEGRRTGQIRVGGDLHLGRCLGIIRVGHPGEVLRRSGIACHVGDDLIGGLFADGSGGGDGDREGNRTVVILGIDRSGGVGLLKEVGNQLTGLVCYADERLTRIYANSSRRLVLGVLDVNHTGLAGNHNLALHGILGLDGQVNHGGGGRPRGGGPLALAEIVHMQRDVGGVRHKAELRACRQIRGDLHLDGVEGLGGSGLYALLGSRTNGQLSVVIGIRTIEVGAEDHIRDREVLVQGELGLRAGHIAQIGIRAIELQLKGVTQIQLLGIIHAEGGIILNIILGVGKGEVAGLRRHIAVNILYIGRKAVLTFGKEFIQEAVLLSIHIKAAACQHAVEVEQSGADAGMIGIRILIVVVVEPERRLNRLDLRTIDQVLPGGIAGALAPLDTGDHRRRNVLTVGAVNELQVIHQDPALALFLGHVLAFLGQVAHAGDNAVDGGAVLTIGIHDADRLTGHDANGSAGVSAQVRLHIVPAGPVDTAHIRAVAVVPGSIRALGIVNERIAIRTGTGSRLHTDSAAEPEVDCPLRGIDPHADAGGRAGQFNVVREAKAGTLNTVGLGEIVVQLHRAVAKADDIRPLGHFSGDILGALIAAAPERGIRAVALVIGIVGGDQVHRIRASLFPVADAPGVVDAGDHTAEALAVVQRIDLIAIAAVHNDAGLHTNVDGRLRRQAGRSISSGNLGGNRCQIVVRHHKVQALEVTGGIILNGPADISRLHFDIIAVILCNQAQIRHLFILQVQAGGVERQGIRMMNGECGGAHNRIVAQQVDHDSTLCPVGNKVDLGLIAINGGLLQGTHGFIFQLPGHISGNLADGNAGIVNTGGHDLDIRTGGEVIVVGAHSGVIELAAGGCSRANQKSAQRGTLRAVGGGVLHGQLARALTLRQEGGGTAAIAVCGLHAAQLDHDLGQLIHRHTDSRGNVTAVAYEEHQRAVFLDTDSRTRCSLTLRVILGALVLAIFHQPVGEAANRLPLTAIQRHRAVADISRTVLKDNQVVVILNFIVQHLAVDNQHAHGLLTAPAQAGVDTADNIVALALCESRLLRQDLRAIDALRDRGAQVFVGGQHGDILILRINLHHIALVLVLSGDIVVHDVLLRDTRGNGVLLLRDHTAVVVT